MNTEFTRVSQFEEIEQRYGNSYFFTPDTMKFFKSRIPTGRVVAGRFFITSEKHGDRPRYFTIRCCYVNTDKCGKPHINVGTMGEFQEFATLRQAEKMMEVYAKALPPYIDARSTEMWFHKYPDLTPYTREKYKEVV